MERGKNYAQKTTESRATIWLPGFPRFEWRKEREKEKEKNHVWDLLCEFIITARKSKVNKLGKTFTECSHHR